MTSTDRAAVLDPEQNERFVRLFAETRDALFSHIFALLPNWSDAEDVFQQTSLVLWRKFGEFDVGDCEAFLAWARRAAYLEVCNFRRVAGRDRLQFDDRLLDHLAEERGERAETLSEKRDFLLDCIAKLTEEQRELLLRAYDETMTIQQLAEEIQKAPQTVYNRLSQIRHTLFKCVEDAMKERDAKERTARG